MKKSTAQALVFVALAVLIAFLFNAPKSNPSASDLADQIRADKTEATQNPQIAESK